jgi:hypothetical protein
MNGVTGCMGHEPAPRSLDSTLIRKQGGVDCCRASGGHAGSDLVVRKWPRKVGALARGARPSSAGPRISTRALADRTTRSSSTVASTGLRRCSSARRSPRASTSTPKSRSRPTVADALDLIGRAEAAGVKHGVVQDKLWLPGLLKLRMLIDSGFFGPESFGARRVRLLGVRGRLAAAQRPSWNYQQGGRRRHHRRHCCAIGATCSTTCSVALKEA